MCSQEPLPCTRDSTLWLSSNLFMTRVTILLAERLLLLRSRTIKSSAKLRRDMLPELRLLERMRLKRMINLRADTINQQLSTREQLSMAITARNTMLTNSTTSQPITPIDRLTNNMSKPIKLFHRLTRLLQLIRLLIEAIFQKLQARSTLRPSLRVDSTHLSLSLSIRDTTRNTRDTNHWLMRNHLRLKKRLLRSVNSRLRSRRLKLNRRLRSSRARRELLPRSTRSANLLLTNMTAPSM